MLVASKEKDGNVEFEVQKEGLLLLRRFRNKRVFISIFS